MTRSTGRVRGLSLTLVGAAGALAFAGLTPAPALAAAPGSLSLGQSVKIFGPSASVAEINAYLQSIADPNPETGQFTPDRHLVLFEPGTYGSAADPVTSPVGYYTEIAGLGASPQDVVINGALHVDPQPGPRGANALDNFWRSLENLTINPIQVGEPANTMTWAVSQAAPLRRVNIDGNLGPITWRWCASPR